MTDNEILKRVIEKAARNGFTVTNDWLKFFWEYRALNELIFSQDFAKAFWGEEKEDVRCDWCKEQGYVKASCTVCEDFESRPEWERRLQHMVLEKNPIKYLEQFI